MLMEQVYPDIRILVRKHKGYWQCQTMDEYGVVRVVRYVYSDGAFRQAEKELEHAYYRIKTRTEILPQLNERLLTDKETNFVNKLHRNNCIGMSKRMYGYLKGIQERNKK